MGYDFSPLSPADFEELARDLLGRELCIRFEAFGPGPDGGIDGRHASNGSHIVLQVKHYYGSTFAALKAQMIRERPTIDRLGASRYFLVTSRPLSPANKLTLAQVIGPVLKTEADILSRNDLNALIRKYPEIERAHIKLWLSSTVVLDRVLHSAAHAMNDITRGEIQSKIRLYAPNPSFNAAQNILEAQHVLIVSGPPGVGKTTLAEILTYAYLAKSWELSAIRSLDDGLSAIDDTKRQIFFFDDFLGKVALDRRALSQKDSDIARFIRRIQSSKNARFILTTRAYILEEARHVSEYLADTRLDVTKYTLDVGVYTREIRARILYNHLLVARVDQALIAALIQSDELLKIVDHKNYNPRIIEWMTDSVRLKNIGAPEYPAAFIHALNHPQKLWEIAFCTHIQPKCQHLLLALFFCSEYGIEIEELRSTYETLHGRLCTTYGIAHGPKDFEDAIRILEGGFVSIRNDSLQFVNPSLRDYLRVYLRDSALLKDIAKSCCESQWAQSVWRHIESESPALGELKAFAILFKPIAEEFLKLPVWKRKPDGPRSYSLHVLGLSNTERIQLLLEWWTASRDARFASLAYELAHAPVEGLDSWRDREAVGLVGQLRDGDYFPGLPGADDIGDALEAGLISLLDRGVPSDELERIADTVDEYQHLIGPTLKTHVDKAICREFADLTEILRDIRSESELDDHKGALGRLGPRAGLPTSIVAAAVKTVEEKITELEERSSHTSSAGHTPPSVSPRTEKFFSDDELRNLFAGLALRS